MKLLFISSGNTKSGISPIIKNQGNSLIQKGIDVQFYTIQGKGFKGYLKSIFLLKKYLKHNQFDIFHAHYSLSAIVATMAGAKPLVVSLMGSDVIEGGNLKPIIRYFAKNIWVSTIVKSFDMKNSLNYDSAIVIPNGVDTNYFKPIDKITSLQKVNWDQGKTHVLFAASKNRPEKNYSLFKKAIEYIANSGIEAHTLEDVDHSLMPYYYNASDVVVLLSKHEGSPNVIKEAMACNRPIVATDVGDIKENIETTDGCYVVKQNYIEVAGKIQDALNYKQTNGRFKIRHLRSEIISEKLVQLYNDIL